MIPHNLWEIGKSVSISIHPIDGGSVIIVDDFLENHCLVRELSDSLEYNLYSGKKQFRHYPGERAQISIYPKVVFEYALSLISDNINQNLSLEDFIKYPTVFTKMNSKLLKFLDTKQIVPHLDIESFYSGIIYLTHGIDENGGTAFYRHKKTGLAYLPNNPDDEIAKIMRQNNFNPLVATDYLEFRKFLMYTNINSYSTIRNRTNIEEPNDDWDLVFHIPLKENRLVLFPSTHFHSPVFCSTDDTQKDIRVTQNLFFTKC
jgi:hypothetical protein